MSCSDEDNELPCVEALIAGTVALMTGWADPPSQVAGAAAPPRHLLARKIVSNLFFLQHHPGLSPGLRQVMANAHQRWTDVVRAEEGTAPMQPMAPRTASRLLH